MGTLRTPPDTVQVSRSARQRMERTINPPDPVQEANRQKPDEKPLKLTANQIAFAALKEQGVTSTEAAKMIGITTTYAHQLNRRLADRFSLTDTKLLKDAHRAVKKLIRGEPFGTIEKVKDSTSLAAAQMVYDRAQPVIRQNLNINADVQLVKVDLSAYQGSDNADVIDITGVSTIDAPDETGVNELTEGAQKEPNNG